jgi:hypothetical protein
MPPARNNQSAGSNPNNNRGCCGEPDITHALASVCTAAIVNDRCEPDYIFGPNFVAPGGEGDCLGSCRKESVPRWLAPDPMPEAALVPRRSKVGIIVCFSLAIAVPAIAAPFLASKLPGGGTVAVAEERSNETPSFESRLWKQDSNVAERPPSAQLSANQRCLRNQGELCPLAVTVDGSVVGASVVIDGLASGSTVTVGLPLGTNGWQLAATDLDKALVRPPEGFVGPMEIVLELRLADNTLLARKPLRLEWVAAASKQSTGYPSRQLDRQESRRPRNTVPPIPRMAEKTAAGWPLI